MSKKILTYKQPIKHSLSGSLQNFTLNYLTQLQPFISYISLYQTQETLQCRDSDYNIKEPIFHVTYSRDWQPMVGSPEIQGGKSALLHGNTCMYMYLIKNSAKIQT